MIDLTLNPEESVQKITDFLKQTLEKTKRNKLIVGTSGGIDSAVVLALCVRSLGEERVLSANLPYDDLNKVALENARLLLTRLQIPQSNIRLFDIKPLVDNLFSLDPEINQTRKGNIMARMRMILLFDLAKKEEALVCGTENRTEYLLGYFTRFGDEASDLEPLHGFYKTQIRQLAKFLGIPSKIIQQPPTAGLWEGQTDEGEFGFSYEEADQILHLYFDQKISKEEIVMQGFNKEIVETVLKRVGDNAFKHLTPYVLDEMD